MLVNGPPTEFRSSGNNTVISLEILYPILIPLSFENKRQLHYLAWGILSCDPRHDRRLSSRLLSTAKSCKRPILNSVLEF